MAVANITKTVVGIFNSVPDAENAVSELERIGIPRGDISLVANKHATGYKGDTSDKTSDVVADAGIGAAIGGVGGLLLSAAGALTIPVIGPILAAGPIAAALAGAGVGAAAGGLIGALTESGIPEDEAKYYAEGVRRGDVLVTVKSDSVNANRAQEILDQNGAIDVNDRVSNWKERGWSGYDTSARPYNENELVEERKYYGGYTSSDPAYRAGSAVERGAERTEDAMKNAGRSMERGAERLGDKTEDTLHDAGRSMERGAHKAGEGIREAGHEVKEGMKDAGRSIRRGAARVYDRLT